MVFDMKVDILKGINVKQELVKKIEDYWNNENVEFKVDCKWLSKWKVVEDIVELKLKGWYLI